MTLELMCLLFPFQDWLSKFGYLPPPDPVTGQLQTKEALTKAIKAMQKFGGLEETGVFGMWLFCFWGIIWGELVLWLDGGKIYEKNKQFNAV